MKAVSKEQKMISRVAAGKSKVSKRTVPCNEALSRVLQLDLTKAMAIVLARRDELKTRPLEIILTGDSLCTACLFSPGIVIKNTLLRSVVNTVRQRAFEIAEILPKATISMSWLPGDQNSADLLSKLFSTPSRR